MNLKGWCRVKEGANHTVKLTGENIGGYKVEEKRWQGATSTVWRCSCQDGRGRWGQTIAVKVLNPYRDNPLQINQFIKEAKIQGKIFHENVVRVYGIVRKENLLGMLMEYVYGDNLKIVSQTTEIKTDWLIRFFSRLASAIGYLHSRGIVHNDIKPENIIIRKVDRDFKLTDFGFAESLRWWSKKATIQEEPRGIWLLREARV